MSEARQLTEAERCSLFLKDRDELVAKVFDGGGGGGGGGNQEGKGEVLRVLLRMVGHSPKQLQSVVLCLAV